MDYTALRSTIYTPTHTYTHTQLSLALALLLNRNNCSRSHAPTFSTASLWLLKPIWQNISNPMPDHAPTPLQATHNQVKTLLQDVCN